MTSDTQSFVNLLNNELELLQSLHTVMLEEQQCVEKNEVEQLIPIAQHKHEILERVEQASRHRDQFLIGNVQASTPLERMQLFIEQSSDSRQLGKQMQALQDMLKQCHEQNEVNAMIISMNQRHVERNLNIMKGIDNSSMTYNSRGTTEARTEHLRGVKA
jgi:flagellar biosynthesis/type III secretory pathway chaperone